MKTITYLPQTLHWNCCCGPSLVLVIIIEGSGIGVFFFLGGLTLAPSPPPPKCDESDVVEAFVFARFTSPGLLKL